MEAAVLGEFTDTKRLELYFHGAQVCDLSMDFLHDGNPRVTKKAVWSKPKDKATRIAEPKNLNKTLKDALGHLNVCSNRTSKLTLKDTRWQ